ncbi:hypothetical protein [Litoreibacter roseus]|nr:hypothetical protein [Litoreibacter roseus]
MRALAISLVVLTGTAHAQDEQDVPGIPEILEQFRGLAEPLMPLMRDFADQLRDVPGYHPPEVLPNGDIIIRKRDPSEAAPDRDTPFGPDRPTPPDGPVVDGIEL